MQMAIPGDVSSAAFLIAATVVLPGSEAVIRRVGLNPTRIRFLGILKELGADIRIENEMAASPEPIGEIVATGHERRLRRTRIHGEETARVIDEIPILAVVAACRGDGLEVRDAEELRVKESDRITAIVENLRTMGASVTEFDDGFCVEPSRLCGAVVKSYGDHRIAMALAVAALTGETESTIEDAECVDISFPKFFDFMTN
jgi:3-phosphoshikimate 1-carboxyvinyltransferase